MILHDLFRGGSMGLLFSNNPGQHPLPLRRSSPQLVPVGLGLGGSGGIPLAPLLDVLLDAVHNPLDHGHAMFAHLLPPLLLYGS
jgi:hypothetical protein